MKEALLSLMGRRASLLLLGLRWSCFQVSIHMNSHVVTQCIGNWATLLGFLSSLCKSGSIQTWYFTMYIECNRAYLEAPFNLLKRTGRIHRQALRRMALICQRI